MLTVGQTGVTGRLDADRSRAIVAGAACPGDSIRIVEEHIRPVFKKHDLKRDRRSLTRLALQSAPFDHQLAMWRVAGHRPEHIVAGAWAGVEIVPKGRDECIEP